MFSQNQIAASSFRKLLLIGFLFCLPGIAVGQGAPGGPPGGGGPGGGNSWQFEINAFNLEGASYLDYKMIRLTYSLSVDHDRARDPDPTTEGFWPTVKAHQGLESQYEELDGITVGLHDVDVRLPADIGEFAIRFEWIGPDATAGEDTSRLYSITIDENHQVTIHPTAWQGPHSQCPLMEVPAEPLARCSNVVGASNCYAPIRKAYGGMVLNLRERAPITDCNSCGGGGSGPGIDQLAYEVSFQPYNFLRDSNFGPGMYSAYDSGGYVSQKWENGQEKTECYIFDPKLARWVVFLDDEYGTAPGDGTMKDRMGYFKHAKLVGGTKMHEASGIEVEHHDGLRYMFAFFDFPSSEGGPRKWRDRDLRLDRIVDRNGREIQLAYGSAETDRFDSVTHWNGDSISFGFGTGAGVSSPATSMDIGGQSYTFQHNANYMLQDMTGPDGWYWSNVISTDPVAQTTVFSITNPKQGELRYHGANDFMFYNATIISQPTAYLKEIRDDTDLTLLRVVPDTGTTGVYTLEYAGGKTAHYLTGQYLGYLNGGSLEAYYCRNEFPWAQVGGQEEQDVERMYMLGAPESGQDMYGNQFQYDYDEDFVLLRKVFDDGTDENYDRNQYKQVTRFSDRLSHVTLFEYDGDGNLTRRAVGLKEQNGNDVAQPEYAEYVYAYSQGLLTHEYDAEYNAASPDMHVTEYEYSGMRLTRMIEPADFAGGHRPETIYTYGLDGLIDSIESPGHEIGQIRTMQYEHNGFGALIKKTYHDGSTERWIYDSTGTDRGRLTKFKDRMGVITRYQYDSQGRLVQTTVNFEHMANDGTITAVNDPLLRQVTTYQYVPGTKLVSSTTTDGKTTDTIYDYRHRVAQTTSYPADTIGGVAGASTEITEYRNNQVFYTQDNFGRRLYRAYSATNQTELIRTVQSTVPHTEEAIEDSASVLALTRSTSPNSRFLITDAIKDAGGRLIELIDPLGTVTTYDHDSRGQKNWHKVAFGTTIEAKTETEYDKDGRVILVRSPRAFDGGPLASSMFTTYEYNGRGDPSRTLMSGSQVLSETTYNPDGTTNTRVDANGNTWASFYHNCCGRMLGSKDPLGHGSLSNTDRNGRITHTAVVENYDSHSNSHDPVDHLTLAEATTRYDALGRAIYQTQWLVPLGTVDSENPPIAGLDGVPVADGITSQTLYDNDLTDGFGFDGSGITVQDFAGQSTYQLSLADCLTKLAESTANGGAETAFQPGAAGSAVVTVNGEGEIQASISDGLGRPVMSAQLEPGTGNLITWACTQYDSTSSVVVDSVAVTMLESRTIDSEGNITRSFTDGGGRTFKTTDAAGNSSTASFDALGNVLTSFDANGVEVEYVYDELGRLKSQTDGWGNVTQTKYDVAGNVIEQIDAKGNSVLISYDQFNRRSSAKDRLHVAGTPSETLYTYTPSGKIDSIVDAEGGVTSYAYNARDERISETHPDHVVGSSAGATGYGIVEFAYDPAWRLKRKTDQAGNTVTFGYDLAGRITRRDYRDLANSPGGTIADSDTFSLDNVGRILTAHSERYDNLVTMTYDNAGRLENESLDINSKTFTVSRTYNSRSLVSQITYPAGALVERNYTSRGQLEEIKYKGAVVDTRTYDAGGRLDTVTYGNGAVTDFDYRDNGSSQKDDLISQIVTTNPGVNKVGTYAYTYDANDNKTTETISGAGFMSSYGFSSSTYDNDDRLTAWNRTDNQKNQSWDLSLAGDWNSVTENGTTTTRSHNAVHEISDINGTALQHDVRGNVTSIPESVHSTGSNLNISWDFDNQPGTCNSGGNTYTARYDAFGRRVTWGPTVSPVVYIYEGVKAIAAYSITALPDAPDRQWVYADYVDERSLEERWASGQWHRCFFHRNQQYSTTALTDDSGDVVERYAYDAYGGTTIMDPAGNTRTSSSYLNPFMYTGRFYTAGTGLYNFRARMYSPGLGRFVSRDPLGFVDGMNLYRGYFAPHGMDPGGTISLFQEDVEFGEALGNAVIAGAIAASGKIACKKKRGGCQLSKNKNNGFWKASDEWEGRFREEKHVEFRFKVKPGSDEKNCCLVNFVKGTKKRTGKRAIAALGEFHKADIFGVATEINFPDFRVDSQDKDPVYWSTAKGRWNYKEVKGQPLTFYATDKPDNVPNGTDQDLEFKMCIFNCDDVPKTMANSGAPKEAKELLKKKIKCISWSAKIKRDGNGNVTRPDAKGGKKE